MMRYHSQMFFYLLITFLAVPSTVCHRRDQPIVEPELLQPGRSNNVHEVINALKEKAKSASTQNVNALQTLYRGLRSAIIPGKENLEAGPLDPYNISQPCVNHTIAIYGALAGQEVWAMRMVDSFGKLPSDILLNFNFKWLGSFDECMATSVSVADLPDFVGQYCHVYIYSLQLKQTIDIGMCSPDSCSGDDVRKIVQQEQREESRYECSHFHSWTWGALFSTSAGCFDSIPGDFNKQYFVTFARCLPNSIELDDRAIATITICAVIAYLMLAGTLYDVIIVNWMKKKPAASGVATEYTRLTDSCHTTKFANEHPKRLANGQAITEKEHPLQRHDSSYGTIPEKHDNDQYIPGMFGQILLSFSIYTNGSKLLSTHQGAGTLKAVNGIRFISMTWVILGHTYSYSLGFGDNVGQFWSKMFERWTFTAISNALLSVDTFFTLSGLLVSYLSLKEMKKVGGILKFKWHMYYFHRFWRLTPPYMLFLLFYLALFKYWSDGPQWPEDGMERDYCRDSWWTNLLYVNNLVRTDKMCMGHSWYLANDMQFFILTPFMLVPLYLSEKIGTFVCFLFLAAATITPGVIAYKNEFPPTFFGQAGGGSGDYFKDMYITPYCRMGPYIIGVYAGYILYKTQCKIQMPKFAAVIGWILAALINLTVLYSVFNPNNEHVLSTEESAAYNALSRTAWGIGVSWVVVACATGNGGFIDTLLSWSALVPLSRLTYCAYLIHPIIMNLYLSSSRTLIHFNDITVTYMFLGHLVLAYAAAFCISLAFESPMMGLEKALLKRDRRS